MKMYSVVLYMAGQLLDYKLVETPILYKIE